MLPEPPKRPGRVCVPVGLAVASWLPMRWPSVTTEKLGAIVIELSRVREKMKVSAAEEIAGPTRRAGTMAAIWSFMSAMVPEEGRIAERKKRGGKRRKPTTTLQHIVGFGGGGWLSDELYRIREESPAERGRRGKRISETVRLWVGGLPGNLSGRRGCGGGMKRDIVLWWRKRAERERSGAATGGVSD